MPYIGETPLERMAAEEAAWRECKALERVLGPCRLPMPDSLRRAAQVLPDIVVTAPRIAPAAGPGLPWGWLILGGLVIAVLAGGRGRL